MTEFKSHQLPIHHLRQKLMVSKNIFVIREFPSIGQVAKKTISICNNRTFGKMLLGFSSHLSCLSNWEVWQIQQIRWGINLPVSSKYRNLHVFKECTGAFICLCLTNYTGAFICLCLTKYTGEFIPLCLTNKLLKYLLLSIKFIYVILYQYNGN